MLFQRMKKEEIAVIIALNKQGKSAREIGKELNRHHSTVSRWLTRWLQKQDNEIPVHLKASGRPRKTTRNTDKVLKRIVQTIPSISARQLKFENPDLFLDVSIRTIQHRLQKELNLPARRAAKKPMLSAAMRKKRLAFARQYSHWTSVEWEKVMFSDESKFTTFSSRPMTVRRPRGSNRFDHRFTQKTVKQSPGVMIWGCFSAKGRGGLFFLPANTTMNAIRYTNVLEVHLLPFMTIHGTSIFQQDSAPCHKAKLVMDWTRNNHVQVLDWPGNSPDLNPIENLWKIMKDKVQKLDTGSIPKLTDALKNIWVKDISVDICKNLSSSMPKRLQSVIKAKGNMTKY
jgi:transposase